MLTIKHIGDNGLESLVSVVSVNFRASENLLIGCGYNCTEVRRYTSGYAYVMNDKGKTVAVYNLRDKRPIQPDEEMPDKDPTAELLGITPRKP